MGADTHDPAGAIDADLAIFEEEVDTVPGPPVTAGAGRQAARAVLAAGEIGEQPVERIQVRLPRGGHDSCSTTVPGG